MNPNSDQPTLDLLREIRDGQKEIIALLAAKRTMAEEQVRTSAARIHESVELQREALKRQSTITRIAVPGILACLAAIGYLIVRYF